MNRIKFTQEHENRLKELSLTILFTPLKFKGLAGTVINVFQMVHETAISSLQGILQNLKREMDKIQNLDSWSLTKYQEQKLEDLKLQYEFVNLLIGYKKRQEELLTDQEKIRELKREYAEVRKSAMSPTEKLEALRKSIEALGDSVEDTAEIAPDPETKTE